MPDIVIKALSSLPAGRQVTAKKIMFYAYVIKSKKHNWYYVGSTANVEKGVEVHNAGQVRSTKFRLPYELIYTEKFSTALEARAREKKIKQSRSLKEDIIKTYGPIV